MVKSNSCNVIRCVTVCTFVVEPFLILWKPLTDNRLNFFCSISTCVNHPKSLVTSTEWWRSQNLLWTIVPLLIAYSLLFDLSQSSWIQLQYLSALWYSIVLYHYHPRNWEMFKECLNYLYWVCWVLLVTITTWWLSQNWHSKCFMVIWVQIYHVMHS